jgi:hypothetical protein
MQRKYRVVGARRGGLLVLGGLVVLPWPEGGLAIEYAKQMESVFAETSSALGAAARCVTT